VTHYRVTIDVVTHTLGPAQYIREQRLTTNTPGVVTGLAYTPMGGEILHIEATRYPGKGNVTRDFTPSLVDAPPGMPAGSRALKLIPKAKQRDYDWLVLVLDPASLAIRGLLTVDAQGGKSSFSFTNLKENVGLADKEFAFKIPRGVDVVTAPSRN